MQYPNKKPFSLIAEVFGHLQVPLLYILVKHLDIITVVRRYPNQHLIQNDTNLIYVTRLRHTLLF